MNLDPQAVFGLVAMLAALALWLVALRNTGAWRRWIKRRERKTPPPNDRTPTGPWG